MRPGPVGSTLTLRLQRPTALPQQPPRPRGQRAGDHTPSPGSSPPSCCMSSRMHVQGQHHRDTCHPGLRHGGGWGVGAECTLPGLTHPAVEPGTQSLAGWQGLGQEKPRGQVEAWLSTSVEPLCGGVPCPPQMWAWRLCLAGVPGPHQAEGQCALTQGVAGEVPLCGDGQQLCIVPSM